MSIATKVDHFYNGTPPQSPQSAFHPNPSPPKPEPPPSPPPPPPADNPFVKYYRLDNGQSIELARELGRGGEGAVYEVSGQPNQVAKIWHPNSNTKDVAQKVALMVRNKPDLIINSASLEPQLSPSAVWPHALLYDDRGNTAGFLMPRIDPDTFRSSFRYFNPASRRDLEQQTQHRFRARDQFIMARNLALAMDKLHNSGYVVGDVNEANLLVNNSMEVTFVDADSMQVKDPASSRTFRCTKGREDYTPPRLQGLRFREHDRTVDDDLFGLAVLIFKITMQGVHPYASTSNPDDEDAVTALGEKIKLRYFPYNESGHTPAEHQPSAVYRTAWQNIPFRLRHLFRLAFDPDAEEHGRPTPQQWVQALHQVLNSVARDARWETPAPAQPFAPPRNPRNRRTATGGMPAGLFGPNAHPSPPTPSRTPPLSSPRAYQPTPQSGAGSSRPTTKSGPGIGLGILFFIMMFITFGAIEMVFDGFLYLYLHSVPACKMTTEEGSSRFRRVAPLPEDDRADLNWRKDSFTLTAGQYGGCSVEGGLDPNRTYVTLDRTEVDLFGENAAVWSPRSTMFPVLGQVFFKFVAAVSLLYPYGLMMMTYRFSFVAARGSMPDQKLSIMLALIISVCVLVFKTAFPAMGIFSPTNGACQILFPSVTTATWISTLQINITMLGFVLTALWPLIKQQVKP